MNKKYIIVGGSHGIGKSLAEQMQGEGAIQILSRTDPEIDTAQWTEINVLEDTLPKAPAYLNGLVYAPGSINLKPFGRLKESDFLDDLKINYLGAVRVLQHYEKALKAGQGAVVLFSTVAVQTGMAFHTSIAGAKGAVEGLVRSLAAEWAPTVRVNGIAPSLTDTPLANRLLRNDKMREASAQRHPLQRIGDPGEIARAASFLLHDTGAWITGQILKVDGGISSIR